MMHPVEEAQDRNRMQCSKLQAAEQTRRSSWMPNRSPFRARMIDNTRDHDMVLSPDSICGTSPLLRRPSYSLMSPTTTSPSKMLLREKLLRSVSRAAPMQENQEGIDDVYENIENVLEALRMERHQEKLRADEEIKQLKDKLSRYESQTFNDENNENKLCIQVKESPPADNNAELAECLLETLALLEEECAEWKNTRHSRQTSMLDNITNQLSPSPQQPQQNSTPITKSTPPQKTPSRKLVKSIQRLRTVQKQLQTASHAKESKSLVAAFDKEIDTGAAENSESTLVGLHLLDGSENSASSLESPPVSTTEATTEATTDTESTTNLKELTPSFEEFEDEVYKLRQQLWNQMMAHGSSFSKLQDDTKAAYTEKENLTSMLHEARADTKRITSEMLQAFQQKQVLERQLKQQSEEAIMYKANSEEDSRKLANIEEELKNLRESSRVATEAKEFELSRTRKDLMIMQTRMMWAVAGRKRSAEKSRTRGKRELLHELSALKAKALDAERKCFDGQMRAGIEENSRLLMSTKLETAMARLDEQNAAISSLQEQLEDSKRMTRAYSSQADYLSDALQQAQMEARESLEDRNQSMRKYRMDAALLRDDLNCSFGVIP